MKSKRHAKILELITAEHIDTQEELLRRLNDEGFTVTQATVSRDIKELRLVKQLSADGQYHYSRGYSEEKGNISSKFYSIFSQSAYSVDFAENLVVVKCFTGMANAACAALDSMDWPGVVGTLSGDDTFLIITRSEENAAELVAQLKKLLHS